MEISLPPPPAKLGIAKRSPTIDWLKASDSTKIGYRFWQGMPGSAVVLYLHGVEGHSQWFENTATILNEHGFIVYAPDRRGSGMNAHSRGHLTKYDVLVDDFEILLRFIKRQHPDSPVFLMANCWGAKLATLVAQAQFTYGDKSPLPPFAGLILTCPAVYARADFPLVTKIQIALAWLMGGQQKLKTWPIPLTTPMLTNNPEYLDYLQKDPLRLTTATAAFFVQTFFLTFKSRQAAKNIQTPTLILQSGFDEIVNIEKLEAWYEKIAAPEKSMHVFPEASHSLDFDSIWFKEYTHLLCNWINARAEKS